MEDLTKNFKEQMYATKSEEMYQCPLCEIMNTSCIDVDLGNGLD